MNVVGFVFARGGSSGLPGKNLARLNGESLIARAIAVASAAPSIGRIVVSTDDEGIAKEALRCGAEIPWMRPAELATDAAPEWLAWQHAIATERGNGRPVDAMVSLPATAPLRAVNDVEATIALLLDSSFDAVITVSKARPNPLFTAVMLSSNRTIRRLSTDGSVPTRRQDAPNVYSIVPVAYAARADFVLRSASLFDGEVGALEVPAERSVDIDDAFDLHVARLLAGNTLFEE